QNKETLKIAYRRYGRDDTSHWFETTAMRQRNDRDNDILLVAMSRNIDAQKAEEIRLQEKLWLQAEEIRVTSQNLRRTICHYDIPTMTLTVPREYAREHNMPEVIHNYPANMDQAAEEYPEDAPGIIRNFCKSMCQGDPMGSCEVPFTIPGRDTVWKRMEFSMVYDREHKPKRAVIFVDDITEQKLQASENRQLRKNEQIFRLIAQHSDRTICYYDIKNRRAHRWDESICARCQVPHLCELSPEDIISGDGILPESKAVVEQMFLDIHRGSPEGSLKMRVKTSYGYLRWFDLQYSTTLNEQGQPDFALISHQDITEQYEHELAYLHHIQSMEESDRHLGMLVADLETDLIESSGGRIISSSQQPEEYTLTDFGRQLITSHLTSKDRKEAMRLFSIKNLKKLYLSGTHQLEQIWQIIFLNGSQGWAQVTVDLIADPYNGHIKAFFRMTDVTEEQNATIEARSRSERDSMTGLLNRGTAESRIRDRLSSDKQAGILILLDLDDLKGINDNLGHGQGDRAILAVADTLKKHFRETDIIGRIGGDEFMIYLTGAAENSGAIAASVTSLLRKMTNISVGANDERHIHCSAGCAVQTIDAHTFEDLYRQADMALYHIKRNGKNNFAFYSPDMAQEDYHFQMQQLVSTRNKSKFQLEDMQPLLEAIATFYPMVLSVNLSANNFFLMENSGILSSQMPTFGVIDDIIDSLTYYIHPDDRASFLHGMSRASLLEEYAKQEKILHRYFRFLFEDTYQWVEAVVIFHINASGDVCDFTLIRQAYEKSYELDQLWLHKVLELAVTSSFEYVCLINIEDGRYTLYGDERNSHGVSAEGDFNAVTESIRDTFIEPRKRQAYYEAARLETLVEQMTNDTEGNSYSYCYDMPDGGRRASFYWFEPTHTHLLMTVLRTPSDQ
ncbi:MAG: diguanylate cyclase, partial [Lachnospiraceae bacterium]|nr:diguanylate cyclase [Lachnospiraceae bacterium]